MRDAASRGSALRVSNNQMTIGALRALQRLQLRVPDDIALACYDDFDWAPLFAPQLTAVAQDVEAIGLAVMQLLLGRLADPARRPERVVIPTEFRAPRLLRLPGPFELSAERLG